MLYGTSVSAAAIAGPLLVTLMSADWARASVAKAPHATAAMTNPLCNVRNTVNRGEHPTSSEREAWRACSGRGVRATASWSRIRRRRFVRRELSRREFFRGVNGIDQSVAIPQIKAGRTEIGRRGKHDVAHPGRSCRGRERPYECDRP